MNNVKNWLHGSRDSIEKNETAFLEEQGDLIAVVRKPRTPLRRFFDRYEILQRLYFFRDGKVSARYTSKS